MLKQKWVEPKISNRAKSITTGIHALIDPWGGWVRDRPCVFKVAVIKTVPNKIVIIHALIVTMFRAKTLIESDTRHIHATIRILHALIAV